MTLVEIIVCAEIAVVLLGLSYIAYCVIKNN